MDILESSDHDDCLILKCLNETYPVPSTLFSFYDTNNNSNVLFIIYSMVN